MPLNETPRKRGSNASEAMDDNGALKALRKCALRIATKEGDFETGIAALTIHRRDRVTAPLPCIYQLGLAITVAGRKQVLAGDNIFVYEAGQSLFTSVDLPVVTRVMEASDDEPYLGLMLRLDPRTVLKVAAGLSVSRTARGARYTAVSQDTLNEPLLNAIRRLVALPLDEPQLLATIAPLILQEIIARVLVSEHGPQFMHLNTGGSTSRQIAQSMAWLKENFTDSISMESLAERSHMSPSTFRQRFRSIAGMSPLQYLKTLRLQEARQLMLNDGLDAGASGLKVGYESVSQFSREYARLFGEPPLRDIKHLRQERAR